MVHADDVELVSERLWAGGADAIGEIPAGDDVELLAGYPTLDDAHAAAVAVADLDPVVEAVTDDSWMDAWRAYAEPIDIDGRVLLWPDWIEGTPPSDRLVIHLDAGRAFGSGTHPSTRLVVRELLAMDLSGARVLDVGCGSGVLAVAAVRLGASRADGVDVDPVARLVTVANAERNGVAGHVRVLGATIDDAPGAYEVVVANIGAAVLRSIAPGLAERAPVLVLAGLLTEQADAVAAAFPGWEAQVSEPDDGWVALVLRRSRR